MLDIIFWLRSILLRGHLDQPVLLRVDTITSFWTHHVCVLLAMLPIKREIVCVFVAVSQVSLLQATVVRSSLLLYFVSTRGLLRHRLHSYGFLKIPFLLKGF